MHPCLHLPEIQDEICKATGYGDDNWSLIALALSCKALFEPAMATAWHTQSTLIPLLQTMPNRPFEIDEDGESYRITRPPRKEDWDRPLFYSRFIRRLTVDSFHGPWNLIDVESNDIRTLLSSLAELDQPLFPNIQVIEWLAHQDRVEDNFRIFAESLGSQLTELTIHCAEAFPTHSLAIIAAKNPNITLLSLTDERPPTPTEQAIHTLLFQACRQLRAVQIAPVNRPTLLALARLPCLEELAVAMGTWLRRSQVAKNTNTGGNWIELPKPAFASLRSLSIKDEVALEEFLDFFASMESTPLRDFSFQCDLSYNQRERELPGVVDKLLSVFTPAKFTSTLRTFTIATGFPMIPLFLPIPGAEPVEEPEHNTDYISKTIRHLLPFSNLEGLNITTPVRFDIKNTELASIACAWKGLRVLKLQPPNRGLRSLTIPPVATIEGLVPLAEGCPHLMKVVMSIDARRVPKVSMETVKAKRREEFSHTRLISLIFWFSPIEDAPSVAAFLGSMFWDPFVEYPADEEGDWWNRLRGDYKGGARMAEWAKVYTELDTLRQHRQQLKEDLDV